MAGNTEDTIEIIAHIALHCLFFFDLVLAIKVAIYSIGGRHVMGSAYL